jgi:hypothetical protein
MQADGHCTITICTVVVATRQWMLAIETGPTGPPGFSTYPAERD